VTQPRTIPLLAELLDDGVAVTDTDLAAPPVAQIAFAAQQPGAPAVDVTGFLPPPTPIFLGRRFDYRDALGRWLHGLLTPKYPAPGTYTVTMVSGDAQEYVVEPTCTATYVVE
jgi:hypothetical protein